MSAADREEFDVGHMRFEVIASKSAGLTFGVRAKYAPLGERDLFSGHVEKKMAAELRALADHIDSHAELIE